MILDIYIYILILDIYIYISLEWNKGPYFSYSIKSLISYFTILSVSFHDVFSLFGFFIFLIIISQLISGTMLSFSVITEPMIVPTVREEEDTEDLYIDDFFWLHERGVDLIFVLSYIHLFRKLYLSVYENESELAWKSGILAFLLFQVVVFSGLVLCCTHLSDITLTIAANIAHTFSLFKGKFYWWLFPDKTINSDTMVRLAYMHYILAFYLGYTGLIHGVNIHYDWKNEATFDGLDVEMIWWDEALANEIGCAIDIIVLTVLFNFLLFSDPESLSYEIFMWGDIGIMTDVRYYGVAPHWYFRPFMAWLIVCPHHKIGVFGLLFFFFMLFFQPFIHGISEENNFNKKLKIFNKKKLENKTMFITSYLNNEINAAHQFTFFWFVMACLYVSSFLPYGRFYNRLGGNSVTLWSFMYIFIYLGFPPLRRPVLVEFYVYLLYSKVKLLSVPKF